MADQRMRFSRLPSRQVSDAGEDWQFLHLTGAEPNIRYIALSVTIKVELVLFLGFRISSLSYL